jgi:L-seryl-tRNA(Sec) kinase
LLFVTLWFTRFEIITLNQKATGKTFFSKKLNENENYNIETICFDEIYQINDDFSSIKWKENQEIMFEMTIKKLKNYKNSNSSKSNILLIEDNFYYKSMRNDYFKYCRNLEISFGEIFLTSNLEKCLKRNQERQIKVPESTIKEMFLKFEYPNKNEMENSIIIDNNDLLINMDIINEFICKLFNNPLKDFITEMEEKKEIDRKITHENKIHSYDVELRKMISEKMKHCKENKKEVSLKLNSIRKEILEKLKTNEIKEEDFKTMAKNEMESIK